MNISPKAGPNILSPPTATATTGGDGRSRAIAKLTEAMNANAAQQPPVNPSRVSPEEFGAVQSQGQDPETAETSQENAPRAAPVRAEEPLSSQYAQLARKERANRIREQQIRARESELRAREETFRSTSAPRQEAPQQDWRELLRQDPITALSEAGITYDQLVEGAVNLPKREQILQKQAFEKLQTDVKAELEALRQSQTKAFEDQQQQAYQQAVGQIRNEARQVINSDPNYETVKATDRVNTVVGLIERTFNTDGILLTVDEAAEAVENHLVDEAIKLTRLKKVQQRLSPPKQQEQGPSQQQRKPMTTLTNSVSSSRPLSARDRAILAFKGELK